MNKKKKYHRDKSNQFLKKLLVLKYDINKVFFTNF